MLKQIFKTKKVIILVLTVILILALGIGILYMPTHDSKKTSQKNSSITQEKDGDSGSKLEVYEDDSEAKEKDVEAPSSWNNSTDSTDSNDKTDKKQDEDMSDHDNEATDKEELIDDEVLYGTIF